ncbi:MAG TPA: penicillin-binding protein 2 [Acidimicrobiales bacterium]|nr:penicillin-binding protein 2 [Acidimicrobiales bacterium]
MSKQIRNLGVFLAVCYVALFLQVNRLTIFEADELKARPENTREIERDFASPRGSVITADGVEIARSVPSDDQYRFQREYPTGALFAHVTGHYAFELGASGLERTYNDELAGDFDFELEDLSDLFVDRERVGNLTLSMRHDVQQAAADQLDGREGSVVAVDPRNGEILALYSNPSYDPNVLADHNFNRAEEASELFSLDPEKPLLGRSYQENFFPGSTFKAVTATGGIERGGVTPDEPVYPERDAYQPVSANGEPVGQPISNFEGSTCGGTLILVLQVSCNSAFAEMGAEDVGADDMIEAAEAFGFNHDVPIDLPDPARSVFPTEVEGTPLVQNPAVVAQLAIGQNEVGATPLQMALVAAAVANGGEIMTPHVVREVRDDQGEVVDTAPTDEVWARAMDGDTADLLHEAMLAVVDGGTASRLDDQLDGFVVGGKTGTAELGTPEPRSHAWIIGFAGPEGEPPSVAVAVIVEGQPGVSEQTGGTVAAPIASAVMQRALERPAAPAD